MKHNFNQYIEFLLPCLGIGGFMVRQRSRTGQGKTKRSLTRKDSSGSVSEQLPGRDEGKCRNLFLIFCSCLIQ